MVWFAPLDVEVNQLYFYKDVLPMYASFCKEPLERQRTAQQLVNSWDKAARKNPSTSSSSSSSSQWITISETEATAKIAQELERLRLLSQSPTSNDPPPKKPVNRTHPKMDPSILFPPSSSLTPPTTTTPGPTSSIYSSFVLEQSEEEEDDDDEEEPPTLEELKARLEELKDKMQHARQTMNEVYQRYQTEKERNGTEKPSLLLQELRSQLQQHGQKKVAIQTEISLVERELGIANPDLADDKEQDEEDVPMRSSKEHYLAFGKDKRILLSVTLGLGIGGSDYRWEPYNCLPPSTEGDNVGDEGAFSPPTKAMLQAEVQRRCDQALGQPEHIPVVLPENLQSRSKDFLVSWLVDHPIRDDDNVFFTQELQAYMRTLPIQQADFATNPTVLSRLISSQDYHGALNRLHGFPSEARVWLYTKPPDPSSSSSTRKSSSSSPRRSRSGVRYSMHQLPLHMACSHLALHPDAQSDARRYLEALIRRLASEFPSACSAMDQDGKLPLHEAIPHNPSEATVTVFLLQDPQLLLLPDKYGRTLVDLARQEAKAIRTMLMREPSFWEDLQKKAREKHQQSIVPLPSGAQNVDLRQQRDELTKRLLDIHREKAEGDRVLEELLSRVKNLEEEKGRLETRLSSAQRSKSDPPASAQENEMLQARVWELEEALRAREDAAKEATSIQGSQGDMQRRVDDLSRKVAELQERNGRLDMQVETLKRALKRANQATASNNEDEESSLGDFSILLDTIGANSHHPAERYLTNLVVKLRAELADKQRTFNDQQTAIETEKARLLKENQHFAKQLHDQRREGKPKSQSAITEKPAPTTTTTTTATTGMDDLDSWLKNAAALYHTGVVPPLVRRPEAESESVDKPAPSPQLPRKTRDAGAWATGLPGSPVVLSANKPKQVEFAIAPPDDSAAATMPPPPQGTFATTTTSSGAAQSRNEPRTRSGEDDLDKLCADEAARLASRKPDKPDNDGDGGETKKKPVAPPRSPAPKQRRVWFGPSKKK